MTFLTILPRSILSVFGIVLLLAQSAEAAEKAFFVGNWYGVGEPDDPSISYIDSYQADGTAKPQTMTAAKSRGVFLRIPVSRFALRYPGLRRLW